MKYLLIATLLYSCTNLPSSGQVGKVSTIKLDTMNSKPVRITSSPAIFETAFFQGTKAKVDTFLLSFYSVDIGKLHVESGKVIACDPIVMHHAKPFSQIFPIGHFPVQLALARVNDDERVAFSRILLSDKAVFEWKFALQAGQKDVPISGETLYGYGVDGGIGLFIDEAANTAFKALYNKNDNIWQEAFSTKMNKHSFNTWQYSLFNFQGHNLASFSTGFGDGTYGTYIGYDDQGQPCRLLTDFGLVQWWSK